jgi:hypothetical protein
MRRNTTAIEIFRPLSCQHLFSDTIPGRRLTGLQLGFGEQYMPLNDGEIAIAKGMLVRGDRQHDIAAYFGVNGGRIAEISTGQRGQTVTAAAQEELPPAGPYMAGRSALRARDTLIALRELIDDAIGEIDLYERPEE